MTKVPQDLTILQHCTKGEKEKGYQKLGGERHLSNIDAERMLPRRADGGLGGAAGYSRRNPRKNRVRKKRPLIFKSNVCAEERT